MSLPSSFVVEIEFVSGTWTDVSAYLQFTDEVTITRGRNTVLDVAQIGTCSYALIGDDGRFTPGYNGSPYYPNVIPNVRTRVTIAGVVRFLGYIDKWEPTFPDGGGNCCIVNVTATDRMRLMSRRSLKSTYVEWVGVIDSNASVWPCDETGGTSFYDALGNSDRATIKFPRSYRGTYELASTSVPYGDKTFKTTPELINDPVYGPTSGNYLYSGDVVRLPNRLPATGWTIAWWQTVSSVFTPSVLANVYAAGALFFSGSRHVTGDDFAVGFDGTSWFVTHSSAGIIKINTGPVPSANALLFLAIVCTSSDMTLYVNGSAVCSQTLTSPISAPYPPTIGGIWNDENMEFGTSAQFLRLGQTYMTAGGNIGDITYSASAISASNIYDMYFAGLTGLSGDAASTRAVRLFKIADIPSSDYIAQAETTATGPLDTAGKDVIKIGQDLSQSTMSLFYVDGTGKARWNNSRNNRATLTPAATFANEADTEGTGYALPIDESKFANTVTINASGGGSYTATNPTSIAAIGTVSLSQDLELYSYTEAFHRAKYYLAMFGTPAPRIGQITVDMMTSSTAGIYSTVFGLDLDARIRVTGLPTTGPASQVDAYIEGWSERYSIDKAEIVFDCSTVDFPADAMFTDAAATYSAAYDGLSRFDCDGSQTLNAGVTSSATSIVATVPVTMFTTTDVPFDIEMDGERMTVTAAAAASGGLQTLTVTRGIDGTNAIAHNSGAAIYIAHNVGFGL